MKFKCQNFTSATPLNPLANVFLPGALVLPQNNTELNPRANIFIPSPLSNTSLNLSAVSDHDCARLNVSPLAFDVSTPNLTAVSDFDISDDNSSDIITNNFKMFLFAVIATIFILVCLIAHQILLNTLKYSNSLAISCILNPNAAPFLSKRPQNANLRKVDSDSDSPYATLQSLRVKNIDKIIIGHINLNSIRNKFDLLTDLIKNRVDILLISETKLDGTFPKPQFSIQGFTHFRLDRTANGGGVIFYIRSDIPAKSLPLLFGDIECIITDITISKKKWIILGSYNPQKSMISNHLAILGKNLCHYLPSYDNVVILGDFNSEIKEDAMSDFCSLYNLTSLIKVPTCFKNAENPSCIDLILTNRPRSFQNSIAVEIGLSDFHKLTLAILEMSFRKKPASIIKYRNYKLYSETKFRDDLNMCLRGVNLDHISNDDYVYLFMDIFNRHAPLKTKHVRANDNPFMTKELRKEHMKRFRLRNIYLNLNLVL